MNIFFKNKSKIKRFRQTKSEIIHFQQATLLEIVKRSSVRKKMIPDKQIYPKKSVKNSKHMGKYKIIFSHFKILLDRYLTV